MHKFAPIPVGAAICRPPERVSVPHRISAFTRNTIAEPPRNNLFDSNIFSLQKNLIAAVGCTFFRKKGDRREAVVRHKRAEPIRPESFIFRILGRFSPCDTDSIDASKKHPIMQKLKLFGCSQF